MQTVVLKYRMLSFSITVCSLAPCVNRTFTVALGCATRGMCVFVCVCARARMSIRECVDHVWVRGTCLSTSLIAPSTLHVTVVHQFGLPNRHGIISCDGHLLHVRFDHRDDRLVHVWAHPIAEDNQGYHCAIA